MSRFNLHGCTLVWSRTALQHTGLVIRLHARSIAYGKRCVVVSLQAEACNLLESTKAKRGSQVEQRILP